MNRLTGYNSFGGVYGIGMRCGDNADTINAILRRLAAYEDTGLTPEDLKPGLNAAVRKKLACEYFGLSTSQVSHIEDLVQADKDGKLEVLPCKVGDAVWGIRNHRGTWHPQRGQVSEMYYTNDMRLHIVVKNICRGVWGEKVFATYAEADKATNGGYGSG